MTARRPEASRGAGNTLHLDGCRDVVRAREAGGNPQTLQATTLQEALAEAQHRGCGEGGDLGDIDPAPCLSRVRS